MTRSNSYKNNQPKATITYGFDISYSNRSFSEQVLLSSAYLTDGLIPPGQHLGTALSQMDKKEARKVKRKFRKIFRKMSKTMVEPDISGLHWGAAYRNPTSHQKFRRKLFVEARYVMRLFDEESSGQYELPASHKSL